MPTYRFSNEVIVATTPEVAFDFMTDDEAINECYGVDATVEHLTPGPTGVGSKTREVIRGPKRDMVLISEYAEFEPGQHLRVLADIMNLNLDTTMTFEPHLEGTRITTSTIASTKKLPLIPFWGRLMRRIVNRENQRRNNLLRAALDNKPSHTRTPTHDH